MGKRTDSRMGVTIAGEDKLTGPMKTAARAFVKASKDADDANKRTASSTRGLHKDLGSLNGVLGEVAKGGLRAIGEGLVNAFGRAVVSAGPALFNLAKSAAEAGDAAFVMSDRVGASTEFLSRMEFAAKQTGATTEVFNVALTALARRAAGATQLFDKWQVSVKNSDGTLKTTEQLFASTAERISGASSSAERLAIAQDLMSEAGRKLVPLLQSGEEGLAAMAAKADRLGITVSTASAAIANKFNNELGATQDTLKGLTRVAGTVFLPALTEALVAVQDEAGALAGDISDNNDQLTKMAREGLVFVVEGFKFLVQAAGFVVRAVDGVRVGFNVMALLSQKNLKFVTESIQFLLKPLSFLLDGLVKIGAVDVNPLTQGFENVSAAIQIGIDKSQDALDQAVSGASQRIAATDAVIEKTNKFVEALKRVQAEEIKGDAIRKKTAVELKADADEREKLAKALQKQQIAKNLARAEADKLAMNEKFRLSEENFKRAEELDKKETERQRAMAEEHKRVLLERQALSEQVGASMVATAQNVGAALVSNLTTTDNVAKQVAKNMAKVFLDMLNKIVQQRIQTALTEIAANAAVGASAAGAAHAGIPFVGLALAGAAASAMFALLSGFVSKFAKGGEVTGGQQGKDSVFALLTPGERVLSVPENKAFQTILSQMGPGNIGQNSLGSGGNVTFEIKPQITTAVPDQALADRFGVDQLLPMLRRLKQSGQLDMALGGSF